MDSVYKANFKRIQSALTGCYKDEFRAGYIVGSDDWRAAMILCGRKNPQIKEGEVIDRYQYFAPCQDTFTYKGFKWI